ncbi:MAG TPA: hypothetical protein VFO38_01730 [Candidatus Saccharimonadales bacterium]|nr:hypothetical protein [Candidatus Saccharimonadales bacterium]
MSDSVTAQIFPKRSGVPNIDATRPFDPDQALKTFMAPGENQGSKWSNADSVRFAELQQLLSQQFHGEPERSELQAQALNNWLFDKLSSGKLANAPFTVITQASDLIESCLLFELPDGLRLMLHLRQAQISGRLTQFRDDQEAINAADNGVLLAGFMEDPRNLLLAKLIRSQVGPYDEARQAALDQALKISGQLGKKGNHIVKQLVVATAWEAWRTAEHHKQTRRAKSLKRRLDKLSRNLTADELTMLQRTPPVREGFSS